MVECVGVVCTKPWVQVPARHTQALICNQSIQEVETRRITSSRSSLEMFIESSRSAQARNSLRKKKGVGGTEAPETLSGACGSITKPELSRIVN